MVSKEFFLEIISGKRVPPIETIEDFTHRYPWCATGHKSLFVALCKQSEEAWLSYMSKASVYLFNRAELHALAHAPRSKLVAPVKEMEIIPDPTPPDPTPPDRIVLARGDYFAQSDLNAAILEEKNPIDKFIKNNPRLTPVQQHEEKEEKASLRNVGEDNFMTETLAKIYADQSLYQLAIDAYKKLILLYPKKNDYFASRIQDLKFKMNR